MKVLGAMRTRSIGKQSYALAIIKDYTPYLSVIIFSTRTQVYDTVCEFLNRAEKTTVLKLQSVCLVVLANIKTLSLILLSRLKVFH